MLSSRKRYLWVVAAFAAAALVVLALLLARVAAERAVSEARLRAVISEQKAGQKRLRAELEEVKERTRVKFEESNEHRDGTWSCERYRCNDGDLVPVRHRELVPNRKRDPLEHWAPESRRRR